MMADDDYYYDSSKVRTVVRTLFFVHTHWIISVEVDEECRNI